MDKWIYFILFHNILEQLTLTEPLCNKCFIYECQIQISILYFEIRIQSSPDKFNAILCLNIKFIFNVSTYEV